MHTNRQQCIEARSTQTLDEVYRLRYAFYRRDDAIDPNPSERFSDAFDETPNHFNFLFGSETAALATVRLSVVRPDLDWTESPARHGYSDCKKFQSIAKASYVEISRLCFAAEAHTETFIDLLGNMAALAEFYSVRRLVVCPRVEQVNLYERLFGFAPVAEPRTEFGLRLKTQLLAVSLGQLRTHLKHDRPIFPSWASALSATASQLPLEALLAA